MVDIVVTAANVLPGSNVKTKDGTAGEAIAAGKVCAFNSSTGKFMLADSNSATPEIRVPVGIALNNAGVNQPVRVQTRGQVTLGPVLTNATAFYLSDTPGGICPVADVGAGEFVSVLGIAVSTSVLDLDIQASGVSN